MPPTSYAVFFIVIVFDNIQHSKKQKQNYEWICDNSTDIPPYNRFVRLSSALALFEYVYDLVSFYLILNF